MYIFIDESGDFKVPNHSSTHSIAVVMGVSVSDIAMKELENRYNLWKATLSSTECKNGEPKGSMITGIHKKEFCKILMSIKGVLVTPVTLDLSSLSGQKEVRLNELMHDLFIDTSRKMHYETGRSQMNLYAKHFKNLSSNQSLKVYAIVNCVREALDHAIIFSSSGRHKKSWNHVKVEIDRINKRSNNREEKVFSLMVLSWLAGWSVSKPFILIREIHTKDHPFIKNFDTENGVDIGKMLRGNIYWSNSSESWGLQIADIASNIVYQAGIDLTDKRGALSLFSLLMRASPYGPRRGPGLFTPCRDLPKNVATKYKPLYLAMDYKKNKK